MRSYAKQLRCARSCANRARQAMKPAPAIMHVCTAQCSHGQCQLYCRWRGGCGKPVNMKDHKRLRQSLRLYCRQKSNRNMDTPSSIDVNDCFGSPPEPIFNETKNGLSRELLQDSLKLLASKNEAAVTRNEQDETEGCFKTKSPVVFLFELCQHFGLRPEVQYWAAELFHRFMLNHIIELYEHVKDSQKTESPIQWSDVENRLKHQIVLRAVSCVQLASKLSSHYSIVSLGRAKAFLTSCGFRYATASIVQSEVRVLKTLDFKVHYPTPVEFLEALLGALGHNDKNIRVKQLHGIALKVLDVFYLSRSQIFSKLRKVVGPEKANSAAAIEADLMLLAASVITAAAFILDQSNSDYVMGHLSQITCIVNEDILNFTSVLLEEIFSD